MRYLDRFLRFLSASLRPCLVLGFAASALVAAVPRNEIQVLESSGTVLQMDARGVSEVTEHGGRIKRGARVKVGADGRLVLALSNGARLLVEGEASFQFATFMDNETRGSVVELKTQSGSFTATLPRQGPGDVFLVRTDVGDQYLKSRGLYQWNATPSASAARLTCLAGETLFVPRESTAAPARLKSGQQLSLGQSGQALATSIEPMDAGARRAIVERLAYDREFKVYPLEQAPVAGSSNPGNGDGTSASLSAVLTAIEDVVERQTQANPSPTGG
jgi:hypothetical protein